MNLQKFIEYLPEFGSDMAALGESKLPTAEYYRVCQSSERVVDLLAEAVQHKCIVAMKGEATVIMPRLIDGWIQVHGGFKV